MLSGGSSASVGVELENEDGNSHAAAAAADPDEEPTRKMTEPKRMSLAEMRSMKQARHARIQRTISEPSFASDDVHKIDSWDKHSLDTMAHQRRVHFLDEVTSCSDSAPTTAPTTPTTGTDNGPVDTAAAAATSISSNAPGGKPLGQLFNRRGLCRLKRSQVAVQTMDDAALPSASRPPAPAKSAERASSQVSECIHSDDNSSDAAGTVAQPG